MYIKLLKCPNFGNLYSAAHSYKHSDCHNEHVNANVEISRNRYHNFFNQTKTYPIFDSSKTVVQNTEVFNAVKCAGGYYLFTHLLTEV